MEKKDLNQAAWKLYEQAISYSTNGKIDAAVKLLEGVLDETDDAALKARCYLRLGQLAEQVRQYAAALAYYDLGLALSQTEKFTAYFLNNNAAYCLNMMAEHQAAEALCRKAIETDASKHNAWKNLGISLEAQGDFFGAAWAYVEATKNEPRDARAYMLLQKLVADHSELRVRFLGILSDKAACLEAIMTATQPQARSVQTSEICRLKYVPGEGYWEQKEGVETPTSAEEIMQSYTLTALKMLDNHPNIWVEVCTEADADNGQPKKAKKTSTESSDMIRPLLIFSAKSNVPIKHFHKPNCRRCRTPLEHEQVAAGLPGRWICKTLGCPKGTAAFPKTSPWA